MPIASFFRYVLHLAVADCLFLLTIPFKVAEDVNDEWIFSGGMCKATEAVLFLNYFSSIFLLMVMCVRVFVLVRVPLRRFVRLSQRYRLGGKIKIFS